MQQKLKAPPSRFLRQAGPLDGVSEPREFHRETRCFWA